MKFDIEIPKWVIEMAKKKGRRFVRYIIIPVNSDSTQIDIRWQSLSKRGWKDMTPPNKAST